MANGTMPPALHISLQPSCENRAAGALRLPALQLLYLTKRRRGGFCSGLKKIGRAVSPQICRVGKRSAPTFFMGGSRDGFSPNRLKFWDNQNMSGW